MEAEVQSLRRDNIRLQEESQTAAAQLRKFTEWFFQTIDRQWSSVTKHCSEKGNHSVKCQWSSSVIFYVIMFCYEVLKSMTHWDTWSLYPIVIKCVFQQERSITVSWVFIILIMYNQFVGSFIVVHQFWISPCFVLLVYPIWIVNRDSPVAGGLLTFLKHYCWILLLWYHFVNEIKLFLIWSISYIAYHRWRI